MEPIQAIIATNLEHLRKQRGLSLEKVAELTGVSKAMLAQIEKGKSNPTVSTLWKIANGLQVSFSMFMKDTQKPLVKKIKIDQLNPAIDDHGHYLVYSIFPFHPEKKFEIYTVFLEPGHSHFSDKHMGEEYILIQKGKLTLEIQGKEYELTANEAINFHSNVDHMYKNDSDEPISFYNVIYYPE